MNTAAAIINFDRRTPAIADDVRRSDRQHPVSELDTVSSRDGEFANLVETFRKSESINVTDIAAKLSTEVFEESGQSTLEKQRADFDSQYRDQVLSGQSDTRLERSSLQARQDLAAETAQLSAKSEFATTSRLNASQSLSSTSQSDLNSNNETGRSDEFASEKAATLRASTLAVESNSNRDSAGIKNSDLTVNQTATAISINASTAAGSVVSAAGRSAVSPAQQIGQLLSADRVGEPSGVRASTSTTVATPSDAGQAGSNRMQDAGSSRVATKDEQASSTKQTDEPTPTDFSKLVRSLNMQAGQHHSQARLHLRPPELGRIIVDVRMEGDTIQIDVQAETEEGRQLLTERAAQLQLALEDAGIVLDRMNVTLNDQPVNLTESGQSGGTTKSGDRLANSNVSVWEEDSEPWQEQPEELLAATMKATRKKLGFRDRARLDVRA